MNKPLILNFLLAVALLPAGAAVMLPVQQQRNINAVAYIQDSLYIGGHQVNQSETRTDAAAWNAAKSITTSAIINYWSTIAAGTVTLNSPALGAGLTSVSASGTAEGSFSADAVPGAFASLGLGSSFGLGFAVDEPVSYRLSGSSSGSGLVSLQRVELPGDGSIVVLENLFFSLPEESFEHTGALLPGVIYWVQGGAGFDLYSDADEGVTSGEDAVAWAFSLEVTPVPEPAAAAVLAGCALAGFAGARRRTAVQA